MDEIQQLRKRIDEVDDQILIALCERVKVCEAIGATKKKQGKPVRDLLRENEIYKRIKRKQPNLVLTRVRLKRFTAK